jgi:hypothetical protein
MDKDLLNQTHQKWIKSGDLVVDLSSFQNGFQKGAEKVPTGIWDYIQYRESLVRWPLLKEKIKMDLSHNNG